MEDSFIIPFYDQDNVRYAVSGLHVTQISAGNAVFFLCLYLGTALILSGQRLEPSLSLGGFALIFPCQGVAQFAKGLFFASQGSGRSGQSGGPGRARASAWGRQASTLAVILLEVEK